MDRIEPRIHDEIKDYKEKFYNFTIRQWIFGVLIAITTIPLYLITTKIIGDSLAGWLVVIVSLPIGFIGFIPIQGLNAEKLIFYWKRNYLNFAKPLIYKTEKELIEEKQKGSKVKSILSDNQSVKLSRSEKKKSKKEAIIKHKQQKKERMQQREIAKAKRKFGNTEPGRSFNNDPSVFNSFSKEEAQVLLKLANRMVEGKENQDESIEEKE